MYKIPAKPVDFLRFLGYGDNFEKLRFVFENDALRLKMREHFVLRIILLGFARNFSIFLQIPILFRTFAIVLLWMAGDESLAR